MKRNINLYIEDIRESINLIRQYLTGVSEREFYTNGQTQDTVVRRLEIIGEAAKNIPQEFKDKHPSIPWQKIAALRNVIAHEYFGVNIERVWIISKIDLPALQEQIENLLLHETLS